MISEDHFLHNHSERVTSVFLKIVREDTSASALNLFGSDIIVEFLKGLGRLFYVVIPSETTFKDPKDVPPFFAEVSSIGTSYIPTHCQHYRIFYFHSWPLFP